MLAPNHWNGEENGCVIGGWDRLMLWEAESLEDLNRAKAESDLTKTQNYWVNNEEKNNCIYKVVLVSTNENQCCEFLLCV